ncbi:MAG: LemA family protein [Planctomycetota bacterium]
MPILFVFISVLVLVPFLMVLIQYNQLVGLKNHIQNSWSNIDTELKRRYELIPNLVATVKGYAAHEKEVLEQVTSLRNRCAGNEGPISSQAMDESLLVSALQRLFVVVENYPQLKSDENYLLLQKELINTEDRIQAARRFFNGNISDYRDKLYMFPTNIIAQMFGFEDLGYFDVKPSVREVPDVEF